MLRRRVTFPAKLELFHGRGFKGRLMACFLKGVGQVPLDRSGGRASTTSMDGVISVLRKGGLLGIYPEGTRSPDGRLYKGKTGVARLVLQAGVPVIPLAVINTQFVPTGVLRIPLMKRPVVRVGRPLDFSAYAAAGNDREVLRWITDEIMDEVMRLSGQEYVDAYGSSVKTALAEGKPPPPSAAYRPGEGQRVPPIPAPRP
jgi:1-acyl-sn-glycerol-3-phosphate acyltransferase